MNNEDRIFEQLKHRLQDYKEQPDSRLWDNIEKKIVKKKFSYIKPLTIIGSIVLLLAIVAVVLVPNKSNRVITKIIPKNNKIITQNIENKIDDDFNYKITASSISDVSLQPSKEIENKIIDKELSVQQEVINIDYNTTINDDTKTIKESNIENVVIAENTLQTNDNQTKTIEQSIENTEIDYNKKTEKIEDMDEELFVPNAFEPLSNEESLRIFKPAYKEVLNYELQIFSRSGAKVFSSKDITIGWDGRIKGKIAEKGTYVYLIKYDNSRGEPKTKNGTLWLHR